MTDAPSEILEDDTAPAIVTDPQTGREFVSPYRYQVNFETEFDHATQRMIRQFGTPTERFAWAFIPFFGGLIGVGVQGVMHGVRFFVADAMTAIWITAVIVAALFGVFAWSVFWAARGKTRFRKRLVDQRLCFDCGYALIGQPIDEHGMGRCPECSATFDVRRYLKPPKRYHHVGAK